MAITIDGTAGTIAGLVAGGLPTGSVTSATILDATVASGDLAAGVGGKVLQVVQYLSTTSVSLGSVVSGTWYDIISGSIQLTSTSNKVLIMWDMLGEIKDGNYASIKSQLLKTTTVISGPTRLEHYYGASDANNPAYARRSVISGSLLYSPNSTSSLTYKIQAANESGSGNSGTYGGGIKAGTGGKDIALTMMEISV